MTLLAQLAATDGAIVIMLSTPPVAADCDRAILSDEERQRARRFAFERDRSAFVTARAELRRQLGTALGVRPETVPIVRDANGRPHLGAQHAREQHGDALDFNLSHSGARVAIAFARGRRVGVDIEWHDRASSLHELVPQVMGLRERDLLRTLSDTAFRSRFFEFWTRKEAIVKAIGVGISYPLTEIDIPSLPVDGAVRLSSAPESVWTVITSEPDDCYTLSVALAGQSGDIVIVSSDESQQQGTV